MKQSMARSLGFIASLILAACGRNTPEPPTPPKPPPAALAEIPGPAQPLPEKLVLDARQKQQAELGKRLFLDKRLSHDNTLSCASCHALENYGVDRLPVSIGIQDKRGAVNAPTVYNSGYNFRQFWDGRAASLEEQAGGPLENPLEMASNWPEVLGKIGRDPALQDLSLQAYGRKLDEAVVRSALAGFERTLITPNAPFDRFLRGDKKALSPEAQEGWQLFRGLGCASCHQGVNLGGNMYATLGVMEDYFAGRKQTKADQGLFNRTAREEDRHKFKVPSLRNVAMTGPYFHDGGTSTLEGAVNTMARTQLGLQLSDADRGRLVAFLKSLTGQLPKDLLTAPTQARP
jgi:cytochrome c peroxidase